MIPLLEISPEHLGIEVKLMNVTPDEVERAIEWLKESQEMMTEGPVREIKSDLAPEIMTIYRILTAASVAYNKVLIKQKPLFEATQLDLFPDDRPQQASFLG